MKWFVNVYFILKKYSSSCLTNKINTILYLI